MKDKEDKDYKPIDSAFTKEVRSDLEQNMDKFKDPVVLGELVYRLLEERENTNRILSNILQKLEALEARGIPIEEIKKEIPMLPEIDEMILSFVKEVGKVTAEEVRKKFNYKGKNAASSRLNRLCKQNLLSKKQVGKKVFFFPV
jgi:RIO-like serine/threonine protein kinase